MDTNELNHPQGSSIMPQRPSPRQRQMVWVMIGIGCFLVVCILVMLRFLFNSTPVE